MTDQFAPTTPKSNDIKRQLIELMKTADSLEQRFVKKFKTYTPHEEGVDGGQLAFHKAAADSVIRVVACGNRWGKSTASINEMVWLATGTHPYRKMKIPNKGKMYGESFNWISQVLEPKLEEWVNPDLLDQKRPYEYNNQGGLTQINWRCGSVTYIGTYEQETRKAEGTDWDYIGFDEPPKKKLWIANFRGLIDRRGIAWIAGTMLDEPWIYDDLWEKALSGEKPHVKVFGGKSSDNPHNPADRIAMFAEELNEDQREVRLNGGFSALSGLVINTYRSVISDIDEFELDDNYVIYEGIDPHSHKPHAVLWKAVDKEGWRVVCGELKFEGSMQDFAAAIMDKRRHLERNGAVVVKSVIDSAINQKDFLTRQNLYQELVRHFNALSAKIIPRIAKKGAGSLEETITILKDLYRPSYIKLIDKDLQSQKVLDNPYVAELYGINTIAEQIEKKLDLKVPKQYIFRDACPMYRRELLRYRWPKDVEGRDTIKPIDDNNEFISCDRYIEQTKPRFHVLHDRMIRTYKHGQEERYQR